MYSCSGNSNIFQQLKCTGLEIVPSTSFNDQHSTNQWTQSDNEVFRERHTGKYETKQQQQKRQLKTYNK